MPDVQLREKDIVATPIQRLVVSGDAIDKVRFHIKRVWGGRDLSQAKFYLKYELPDGDRDGSDITEVIVDGQNVIAVWEPRGKATSMNGRMFIQLEAVLAIGESPDITTYIWQSKIVPINVERTIPRGEILGDDESFLDQVLGQMSQVYLDTAQARDQAETFRDQTEGFKDQVSGFVATTSGHAAAAYASAGLAEGHANDARGYMEAAQASEAGATGQVNLARTLYGDLSEVSQAAQGATLDAGRAEAAQQAAEAAQGLAEAAQGNAENVYDDMVNTYEDLTAVQAAKIAAETAQGLAEAAKDGILNDAGFIGVSTNLVNLLKIYNNQVNINKLAAIDAMITALGAIEQQLRDLHAIRASIANVAANQVNIDGVAGNKTNIDAVNANKGNINILAAIKNDIVAVASIYEELAELGPVVDQVNALLEIKEKIDALYDELDSIGSKVNKEDYPFEIINGMVHIVYTEED